MEHLRVLPSMVQFMKYVRIRHLRPIFVSLPRETPHVRAVPGSYLPHGPLTRYVKLQVAHAPGMPGTFSPAADFKGNR